MSGDQVSSWASRVVISTWILLLSFGGAVGGIIDGFAYAHYRSGSGTTWAAVFIGIGTALTTWLLAALLGLYLEMANSARQCAADLSRLLAQRP